MRSKTATWFETKVKYEKMGEDSNKNVTVSETYVVDALSFTEAENTITEEVAHLISGDFKITGISKATYGEVFFSEKETDDYWFKCKLQFITFDEKTDKEKRSNVLYLVQAHSLAQAVNYVQEFMGGTMITYDIVNVMKTKIADVFEHAAGSSKPEVNDVPEYQAAEA